MITLSKKVLALIITLLLAIFGTTGFYIGEITKEREINQLLEDEKAKRHQEVLDAQNSPYNPKNWSEGKSF